MNILYPIVFVAGSLFALFTLFLLEYFFMPPKEMDEEIGEEDER